MRTCMFARINPPQGLAHFNLTLGFGFQAGGPSDGVSSTPESTGCEFDLLPRLRSPKKKRDCGICLKSPVRRPALKRVLPLEKFLGREVLAPSASDPHLWH